MRVRAIARAMRERDDRRAQLTLAGATGACAWSCGRSCAGRTVDFREDPT
jgi:hypothetical protein